MNQLGAIALLVDLFKVLIVVVAVSGFTGLACLALFSCNSEVSGVDRSRGAECAGPDPE